MIYEDGTPLGGEWHCPFTPEWVAKMRHAVNVCTPLTEEYIDAVLSGKIRGKYRLPPSDFLSEEQDARGLPLSYCEEEEARYRGFPESCTATYDYDSIPEIVITNGYDDWPLHLPGRVLTA